MTWAMVVRVFFFRLSLSLSLHVQQPPAHLTVAVIALVRVNDGVNDDKRIDAACCFR
jgi:hypothetical protein